MYFKHDPGPCPVDDAPHTTCVAPTAGTLRTPMFTQRDGVVEPPLVGSVAAPARVGAVTPPLLAETIQATLPEGQVTTATYRRPKRPDGKRPGG